MTSPYEGFPLAASETMMLGFRRSQQTLNAIEYILDDRGADLLIKVIGPKLDGDRLHRNTKATIAIGRSPVDFSKWPPTLS